MNTNAIERIYAVTLCDDRGTAFEPVSVSLSWPEHEARSISRDDQDVYQRAVELAAVKQRTLAGLKATQELFLAGIELSRERLIHASKAKSRR